MSVPATPVVALTPAQAAAVMKDASRPTQWTNYNLVPTPYPWSNVYTPVSYTTEGYKNNRGILNSSIPPNQNQNTQFHHLNQPRPANIIPQTGLQLEIDPQWAHVNQSGGSFLGDAWNGIKKVAHHVKRGHDVVRENKYISRGLDIASHFRPDLEQYADKARQLGYGTHALDGADRKYFQTGGSSIIYNEKYDSEHFYSNIQIGNILSGAIDIRLWRIQL